MKYEESSMIAVVIPAYKTKLYIKKVIEQIGGEVNKIYVVDDGCPQDTGKIVQSEILDPRVEVIFHTKNLGIGAAVRTGCMRAINDGHEIIVKIDSDGQMNPLLISEMISPISNQRADYVKGNRFSKFSFLKEMPKFRIFGNTVLSFITKFSSGYWQVFDPTNGFIVIRSSYAKKIFQHKVAEGYFFESDMLFWLYIHGAKIQEISMKAVYRQETSSLVIWKTIPMFIFMHIKNFIRRIYITYFLKDFSLAGFSYLAGNISLLFGVIFGFYNWNVSTQENVYASPGTVMLAALPIILGVQLLLYFFSVDISNSQKLYVHDDNYLEK